jgi:hypothetical protein
VKGVSAASRAGKERRKLKKSDNRKFLNTMQTHLAQFSFGRIMLHAACACRDHKYAWHWQGVVREIVWLHKLNSL